MQRIESSQLAFVVRIAYIGSKYFTVSLILCFYWAYLLISDLMKEAMSTFLILPDSSLISSTIPNYSLIFFFSSSSNPSSAPSAITTTQCPFTLALSMIYS